MESGSKQVKRRERLYNDGRLPRATRDELSYLDYMFERRMADPRA